MCSKSGAAAAIGVQTSVGVSALRFNSCCNSRADIPLAIADTLTDGIIDNTVAHP